MHSKSNSSDGIGIFDLLLILCIELKMNLKNINYNRLQCLFCSRSTERILKICQIVLFYQLQCPKNHLQHTKIARLIAAPESRISHQPAVHRFWWHRIQSLVIVRGTELAEQRQWYSHLQGVGHVQFRWRGIDAGNATETHQQFHHIGCHFTERGTFRGYSRRDASEHLWSVVFRWKRCWWISESPASQCPSCCQHVPKHESLEPSSEAAGWRWRQFSKRLITLLFLAI